MRLWAAFRARMLRHAEALAVRGLLESAEEIWLLTTAISVRVNALTVTL